MSRSVGLLLTRKRVKEKEERKKENESEERGLEVSTLRVTVLNLDHGWNLVS